jgi:cytochrome P450 family 6
LLLLLFGVFVEFEGDNLVAQPALFFIAGFETNATTLSFTLYELALQPHLQKRLRAEIAEVMDRTSGAPTYEDVFGMTYLGMVVSGRILSNIQQLFSVTMRI